MFIPSLRLLRIDFRIPDASGGGRGGLLPLQTFTDDVVASLGRFAPPAMLSIIKEQMVRVANGQDGGIFTLGLLGALWSSSAAMVAMIGAMNRAP